MNIDHLDIHRLRCLDVLIAEAHVTRAAERMGMSQPAMSATLGRLRVLCGDPLLVRTERGMAPTQRALDIAQRVRAALELLDGALDAEAPFDPAHSDVQITIAASDSVSFVLMPPLISVLRRDAPGVRLKLHTPELVRVRQSMEDGEADLLVSYLRPRPQGLRATALMQQKLCVIASATHPHIRGSISLAQYLEAPHARYSLSRTGSSTIENEIDAALRERSATRTIGVSLPSALSSPAVVAASDLIATIPERLARHFAPQLGLQVLEPPLPLSEVEISMYWHERMHNSPAHRWLRQCLLELAKRL
jgi:DNA-binding transcriptional LysR family regulator